MRIEGTFAVEAGGDINFFVFDDANFQKWKDNSKNTFLYSAKREVEEDFLFPIKHSDKYYFVIDNTFSWFTNKVVSIEAEMIWIEEEIIFR